MTLLQKAVMNMPPPDVSPSTLNRQFSEDCPIVLGKESGSPCRMSHLVFWSGDETGRHGRTRNTSL